MVKINTLIEEGKLSRIGDLELERYINFFNSSYGDNLKHSEFNKNEFPRWAIISGYYAMHDISKLLIVKTYGLKVEFEVHSTTIKVLNEILKDKEIFALIDQAYFEFKYLANDLFDAKNERVKTQYFTGSEFMHDEYKKKAENFIKEIVNPFIEKINILLEVEK
ncbi:MAG: hypothetical protein PF569_06575 [Candidatus Woesearchaeota archaeon]|jgi:hypothetical protein|nr:hypothetical protein [Candidatus Woesearchaeota archaeon]